MTGWVYVKSEAQVWTTGFYDPDGEWQGDEDHDNAEAAARRVNYLNGGSGKPQHRPKWEEVG